MAGYLWLYCSLPVSPEVGHCTSPQSSWQTSHQSGPLQESAALCPHLPHKTGCRKKQPCLLFVLYHDNYLQMLRYIDGKMPVFICSIQLKAKRNGQSFSYILIWCSVIARAKTDRSKMTDLIHSNMTTEITAML